MKSFNVLIKFKMPDLWQLLTLTVFFVQIPHKNILFEPKVFFFFNYNVIF